MRWPLSSLLLFPLALIAAGPEASILSDTKREQLELKKRNTEVSADKLERSWINAATLSAVYSKSSVGTPYESTSKRFSIGISQDIFRSGGIWYAIQYAKAGRKAGIAENRLEERSLIASAYTLLFELEKNRKRIAKQKLLVENAKIDIFRKREQFIAGLIDGSFLDNAILSRNTLESGLLDLEEAGEELLRRFRNMSDADPETVELPRLETVERDAYLANNLLLAGLEHRIDESKRFTDMTDARYLPKLTLDASYVKEDSEQVLGAGFGFEVDETFANYGLTLSIPLDINTFREKETAELAYRLAQNSLDEKKREEANLYDQAAAKLERLEKRIALAEEDAALYRSLLEQTREQTAAGLKTSEDLDVMKNSLKIKELDREIHELERQAVLLELYAKSRQ